MPLSSVSFNPKGLDKSDKCKYRQIIYAIYKFSIPDRHHDNFRPI